MNKRVDAEILALKALTWLMSDEDLRDVFLGATGLSEHALRGNPGDPDLLASVLDFLLMDDAWIIRFCDAHALPYAHVQHARTALPGGLAVHWT